GYNPDNLVSVDINENNVTLAIFKNRTLEEFVRIETKLGKIVIAYSERRKRIEKGKSTKTRSVRKALRKLKERKRKLDIIYKVARVIENVARMYNARVVVGDVYVNKDDILEKVVDDKLRHRIHQWSVSKLVGVLSQKPLYVECVPEEGSSNRDPFRKRRKLMYASAVIRFVKVSGGFRRRVKVEKATLRTARLSNGWILDRDMVGSLNIGLKALNSDGSPMALGSTEPHEVRAKLVNPYRGLTQTTELKILGIFKGTVV
ncbi:MAG: transposase, partial [Zestosphaera tikiterensis]